MMMIDDSRMEAIKFAVNNKGIKIPSRLRRILIEKAIQYDQDEIN
jgi:hypothetical protein